MKNGVEKKSIFRSVARQRTVQPLATMAKTRTCIRRQRLWRRAGRWPTSMCKVSLAPKMVVGRSNIYKSASNACSTRWTISARRLQKGTWRRESQHRARNQRHRNAPKRAEIQAWIREKAANRSVTTSSFISQMPFHISRTHRYDLSMRNYPLFWVAIKLQIEELSCLKIK